MRRLILVGLGALAVLGVLGVLIWSVTGPATTAPAVVAVRPAPPTASPSPAGAVPAPAPTVVGTTSAATVTATAAAAEPFVQSFAQQPGVKPFKPLPSPTAKHSVPVNVDGCDHAYGKATQCIPWTFPAGTTDKCAWLAAHGYEDIAVVGTDRQKLDPDGNKVACG